MLMKVLVSVLLLQATMSIAEKCSDNEIVTKRITDVNETTGNWTVVYNWVKDVSFTAIGRSPCIMKASMAKVTAEEVAAKKEECKHEIQVPFDYDSVILKLVVSNVPDRLISHDGEYAYIQHNCNLVTKVDARKVSDNYVLMVYQDSEVAELLSRTVPDREELLCTVRNIDVTKNKIGFALCFA